LRLAVGNTPNVGLSEPIGPVDASEEPLVFGSSLVGNLDRLQLYDLTRPPLLVFPGNVTQFDVTLDAEGRGQTTISATGVWMTPEPFHGAAGAAAVSPDSVPVGQKVPLRFHFALQPPTQENESVLHHLGVHTADSALACAEGIATGENDEVSGIACDISVSLIVPLEGALAVRDLTITAKNIIKSKATAANYVAGAAALITILPKRLPVVGPVLRRLSTAANAINVPWVQRKLAAKSLDAAVEATEGIVRTADESLIKIAAGESGPAAKQDLLNLINGIDAHKGEAAWETVEALARNCIASPVAATGVAPISPAVAAVGDACYVPEQLLNTVAGIASRQGPEAFHEVLHVLAQVHFPTLSADALEGIAITMRRFRTPEKDGVSRIINMWESIRDFAPGREQEVANNLFKWIKEAEAANIPGWGDFLAKGPGTLPTSTHGAYHVLEYLSRNLNWQGVARLEADLGSRSRFIDVVMTSGHRKELKNLLPGSSFSKSFAGQVGKDVRSAIAASLSPDGTVNQTELIANLKKIEYIFRGSETDNLVLVSELRAQIRKVLKDTGPDLAPFVVIHFLNRSVPF
jgi:hypothetical protein